MVRVERTYRLFEIEKVIWGDKYGLSVGDKIRVAPASERNCEQLSKAGSYRLYLQNFQSNWQLIRQCDRSAVLITGKTTTFDLWDHQVIDSVARVEHWIRELRTNCIRTQDYEIILDKSKGGYAQNPIIRAACDFSAHGLRRDVQAPEPQETPEVKQVSICWNEKQMPLPGGDAKDFQQYVSKNIRYPQIALDNGLQGVVVYRVLVDENGKLSDIQLVRGGHPVLDSEAKRVITEIKQWTIPPGYKPCYMNLPIRFKLSP